MIKTPSSTVIGGAFWTPGCTIIGGNTQTFAQLIKKLFANGEEGFWYDPDDLSTMYQDAAGTVPVTAVGQPIGLIKDKSGRNNHAYQTTSAARPILRKNAVTGANYLEFDGADDHLIISGLPAMLGISIACAVQPRQSKTNPVLGRGVGGYLYVSATLQVLQNNASALMTNPDIAEAVIATSALAGTTLKTKVRNKSNTGLLDREGVGSGGYANTNNMAIGAFTAVGGTPGAIDLYGIIVVNKIIGESDEDNLLAHYNKLAGA